MICFLEWKVVFIPQRLHHAVNADSLQSLARRPSRNLYFILDFRRSLIQNICCANRSSCIHDSHNCCAQKWTFPSSTVPSGWLPNDLCRMSNLWTYGSLRCNYNAVMSRRQRNGYARPLQSPKTVIYAYAWALETYGLYSSSLEAEMSV